MSVSAAFAAPETQIASAPEASSSVRSATFAFASPTGAAFSCSLDGATFEPCASPWGYADLTDDTHSFLVRAADADGDIDPTPAAHVWTVDTSTVMGGDGVPPGPVRAARAVSRDHAVELTWKLPNDSDLAFIEVRRVPTAETGSKLKVMNAQRATSFTDKRIRNDVRYRYTITGVDESGNRSTSVVVSAKPRARLLVGPIGVVQPRSRVLLRWAPVKGAKFYNVQVFRGQTKVLSVWPRSARRSLGPTWRWDRKLRALKAGVYTWYVWPAVGSRARAQSGPPRGKSTFRVGKRDAAASVRSAQTVWPAASNEPLGSSH